MQHIQVSEGLLADAPYPEISGNVPYSTKDLILGWQHPVLASRSSHWPGRPHCRLCYTAAARLGELMREAACFNQQPAARTAVNGLPHPVQRQSSGREHTARFIKRAQRCTTEVHGQVAVPGTVHCLDPEKVADVQKWPLQCGGRRHLRRSTKHAQRPTCNLVDLLWHAQQSSKQAVDQACMAPAKCCHCGSPPILMPNNRAP